MTAHHPLLLYRTDFTLRKQLFDFISQGINAGDRCIFITSQNDGNLLFQDLKKSHNHPDVVKLFSYFSVSDPEKFPMEFEKKLSKLSELVINENFRGRIAFNVLCDVSRFTSDTISKIENAEKYIFSITNKNSQFFCTYKVGEKNSSLHEMMEIGFLTHDHIYEENKSGTVSEVLK